MKVDCYTHLWYWSLGSAELKLTLATSQVLLYPQQHQLNMKCRLSSMSPSSSPCKFLSHNTFIIRLTLPHTGSTARQYRHSYLVQSMALQREQQTFCVIFSLAPLHPRKQRDMIHNLTRTFLFLNALPLTAPNMRISNFSPWSMDSSSFNFMKFTSEL